MVCKGLGTAPAARPYVDRYCAWMVQMFSSLDSMGNVLPTHALDINDRAYIPYIRATLTYSKPYLLLA